MTEKLLGKIEFAEFGTSSDYPFIIGLWLGFKMNNCQVMDGGKYTVNISEFCKWDSTDRAKAIIENIEYIQSVLSDANVNYVSELIGKPVEVTIEGNTFKDFRILTEVL